MDQSFSFSVDRGSYSMLYTALSTRQRKRKTLFISIAIAIERDRERLGSFLSLSIATNQCRIQHAVFTAVNLKDGRPISIDLYVYIHRYWSTIL